jgi:hypothetical protein
MSRALPADYVPRAHRRINEAYLVPFEHRAYLRLVQPPNQTATAWETHTPTPWELEDAGWLQEHLAYMGLRAYHYEDPSDNRSGTDLIGFADPTRQHPHDRWLYLVMAGSWYRVSSEGRPGSAGYGVGDLKTSVEMLWEHLQYFCGPNATNQAYETGLRHMHLLGMEEDDSEIEATRRLRCKPGPDMHEVHELLYHRHAWRTAHPEAAELPIELVLRMHGFAPLLDEDRRALREDYGLPDLHTWGLDPEWEA